MKRLIKQVIEGQTPLVAPPDITVQEAAKRMCAHNVGAILIVKNNQLIGIFSERDLMKKVVAAELDPATTLIASVMVEHVQTITADRTLAEALHMMHEGRFRHVPVLDQNRSPIGVVSSRDALSGDLADFELETRRMEELEEIIG
jgi:CBS domain-containing protein